MIMIIASVMGLSGAYLLFLALKEKPCECEHTHFAEYHSRRIKICIDCGKTEELESLK